MFIKHGDGKILNIVKVSEEELEDDKNKKALDETDSKTKNSTSSNNGSGKNFRR